MGRLLADFILGICWLVSVILVNNFKRCQENLALWHFGTQTIWHQHRTRYQIWSTIKLNCVSKNLTHRRRPEKFHFLWSLPKQNDTLLSHVNQSGRGGFPRKNCCSFGFCPNYLPPFPQFGQLVQLFSDVEIQDLKVSLGLKILHIHYNIQPKKQF